MQKKSLLFFRLIEMQYCILHDFHTLANLVENGYTEKQLDPFFFFFFENLMMKTLLFVCIIGTYMKARKQLNLNIIKMNYTAKVNQRAKYYKSVEYRVNDI